MATYPNGQWPADALVTIPGGTKMGGSARIRAELLPSIVAMQAACFRDTGLRLRPTSAADAYRPRDAQERAFFRNYQRTPTGTGDVRRYLGVLWYRKPGFPSAAVPGTSKHGNAEAVDWADMSGPLLRWMRDNAGDYGWENPLWARDNVPSNGSQEPWHWEPLAGAYLIGNPGTPPGDPGIPDPGGTLPPGLIPEEGFLMALDEHKQDQVYDWVRELATKVGAIDQTRDWAEQITPQVGELHDRLGTIDQTRDWVREIHHGVGSMERLLETLDDLPTDRLEAIAQRTAQVLSQRLET